MKRAYIFGCSHAAGSEMFDNDIDREYLNSYPALIARDLGYAVHNHAIPGGSNDAIFRILSSISQDITSDDAVIFCWTGPDRSEFFSEDADQWLQFSVGRTRFLETVPHPVALQGTFLPITVQDESVWQKFFGLWQQLYLGTRSVNSYTNRTRNVTAANCLATQRTANVINLTSFAAYCDEDWPLVCDWQWPLQREDFCSWCEQQQFSHTAYGHFGTDAHRAFADYVLTHLDRSGQ